jgi:predicted Zn-dependent peptidase
LYKRTVLNNGLRLIVNEVPYARSVSLVFFVGTGGCYESLHETGISHFIEHVCFKGTRKRKSAREISEAIEGVGGIINGGTDKEFTVYWVRVTNQHFPLALDVLTDLLRNPRFNAEDMERERLVILEEIKMGLDSPRQRVDMLIDELLWPGQPLGRDVAGTGESLNKLTRRQIKDYYTEHYVPDNIVVSIAGNIRQPDAQQSIERSMSDWLPGKKSVRYPSEVNGNTIAISVEQRDTEQVYLCLGFHGVSILNSDRFVVDLFSIVLGEGMSSRLFSEVRENLGLAYEINSSSEHYIDSGSVVIRAGVDIRKTKNALTTIIEQLNRARDDITKSELARAKEIAKGRLLLALENTRSVANWSGAQELITGNILTVEQVVDLVDSVTVDDIRRVMGTLITGDNLKLAMVGPVVETEEELSQLLKM